jgi:hypothetical protein
MKKKDVYERILHFLAGISVGYLLFNYCGL